MIQSTKEGWNWPKGSRLCQFQHLEFWNACSGFTWFEGEQDLILLSPQNALHVVLQEAGTWCILTNKNHKKRKKSKAMDSEHCCSNRFWLDSGVAQVAGWTLFLGVSVRVFQEKISIWISAVHKAEGVCGGRLVQSSGPEKNKKMEKGQIHSLLELNVHLPLLLDIGAPGSWAFRLWYLTHWLPCFLGLWTWNGTLLLLSPGSPACKFVVLGPCQPL